jgi:riboflavin kinase/FMN adenylyltransferase
MIQSIHAENGAPLPKTAVALGLFDGVHRGHQAVIQKAAACAPELTPAVFTFRFDRESMITKPHFARLLSPALKEKKLADYGIRIMLEPDFSAICSMAPEEFFREILCRQMNAGAVFCGEDFRFGKDALGDVDLLRRYCDEAGVRFATVPPLMDGDLPISSTRIRQALRAGEIELANRLLGFPYQTDGEVVHGRHLGHTLGFPTINQLFPTGNLVPRYGVYATIAEIDGVRYIGATDIGVKPTIGEGYAPAAETYLLDFSGDLYGRNITLSYHAFLRGERKFSSLEELTATVLHNADQAKQLLTPLI